MSAYYDLFEKPDVRQTGEQQSLYARFVPKGTIDRKEFIERYNALAGYLSGDRLSLFHPPFSVVFRFPVIYPSFRVFVFTRNFFCHPYIFSKYFLFYPSILVQKHIFLLFPFYCAKLFILLTQKTGDLIWNC